MLDFLPYSVIVKLLKILQISFGNLKNSGIEKVKIDSSYIQSYLFWVQYREIGPTKIAVDDAHITSSIGTPPNEIPQRAS